MANLSKIKRDNMIAFLEELKKTRADDASIRALNEIENHLREKKYGLVWEEHSEEVDELLAENIPILTADPERRLCKDESLPWNFIIEGDNLQALYLLEKTHKGRVDCIYIDPPYNTGAKDWKYNNDYVDGNDVYRHSKWLSMMKSRLLLAKHLLNPDESVLIVTIDEKEYLHLGCLLEEMFSDAKIQMISSVINPKGTARTNEFSRVNEFIFFVMIGDYKLSRTGNDMLTQDVSEDSTVRWRGFPRTGRKGLRPVNPGSWYPIYYNCIDDSFHSVGEAVYEGAELPAAPEGTYAVWPPVRNGEEYSWAMVPATFRKLYEMGAIKFGKPIKGKGSPISYLTNNQLKQIENGLIQVTGRDSNGSLVVSYSTDAKTTAPKTQWNLTSHEAGAYGTNIIGSIIPGRRFAFPKSLYAVHDSIRFFIANKPEAIVVDFFAGSGTTMHAVNLLNAEDGGKRTCIMVTNNEISAAEENEFKRRGIGKGSEEWEARGIAKYVTWPRTVCSINGVDVNGNALKGSYLGSDIPMADGFRANVKFFKCGWTPRKPEDYLLSNILCLHIREMIELQNAIEIDNVRNVLILNRDDFKDTILNPGIYAQIENVWVNQNMVLNSEELKLLEAKGFKYIPREFFGQELREAAE